MDLLSDYAQVIFNVNQVFLLEVKIVLFFLLFLLCVCMRAWALWTTIENYSFFVTFLRSSHQYEDLCWKLGVLPRKNHKNQVIYDCFYGLIRSKSQPLLLKDLKTINEKNIVKTSH